MREIKPCPFCGNAAKVYVCDSKGSYSAEIGTDKYMGRLMTHCLIKCPVCRIRTDAYLTRRGAYNAWNRRAGE